jgi:cytochrome oxidase assembly protein ShyY1
MDDIEFRKNWEYFPIEIKGIFDYNNKILISTTRSTESGYNVIMPFYCYNLENKGPLPILVDRGWVPKIWMKKYDEENEENFNKIESIKGILYKGDKNNKFSKENDLENKKFFTTRPDELAKYFELSNQEISSKFIIKEIIREEDKKIYPEKVTINDIMFTQITPKKHQDYAYFWMFVSILNFSTNIYIWLL